MWRPADPLILGWRLGLALATVGLVLTLWPSREIDAAFVPRVRFPAMRCSRALILIDGNTYTIEGRFLRFVRLARADGYRAAPNLRRFPEGSLHGVRRGGGLLLTAGGRRGVGEYCRPVWHYSG
ncbi:MAG TPA: hypothetical protein VM120_13935 [Bryobacteraceae bacterium]|nr:hypothetical protein [Bryobacteraceae bacterium]